MTRTEKVSLWDSTAAEADYENPLDGNVSTEFALIGGGFTGLSAALHAATLGIQCHVFEANHIGYGAIPQ